MSIEFFWGSGSTPAWRAMLGFKLKGVPYESRLLSFSEGDTRKPAFLAINPRGKVPTIREGDFVLNESLAILAWLQARFPEGPPLFGTNASETGQVWRHIMEFESHASPAYSAVARPILFQGADAETLAEPIAAAQAELDRFAALVNGPRGARPLVGDRLSAADLVWYTGVRYLERAATRPNGKNLGVAPGATPWGDLIPWARLIEAIPGFAETVPPHWLTGVHPLALTLG